MSRYIDVDLIQYEPMLRPQGNGNYEDCEIAYRDEIDNIPTADVVEEDKAQKEIDYWHDKAQSYEQTILKLSLNKADVVEVVRCKDCVYRPCLIMPHSYDFDYCSYGL